MREIKTDWVDGSATLVALINSAPPPSMIFHYEERSVAHIDEHGNLHIKGQVFENCDPKKITLVHDSAAKDWSIWKHPVVFYDFKKMESLLHPDPNSPQGLSYPLCFWDEANFYVWGDLGVNTPGSPTEMIVFSPITIDGFDHMSFSKTSIRGVVISESTKVKDEPQAETEQPTI